MLLVLIKGGVLLMSPKMGRPKAENPKDVDLKVRVDRHTSELLCQYAQKHNLTKAGDIRQGIMLLLQQK